MIQKRKPNKIYLESELDALYKQLSNGHDIKKFINEAKCILEENIFVGEKIRKSQIPNYYVEKFGINNLYRLRIRNSRSCYTIISNGGGVSVTILEIFQDHRSYNKRFGYK